MKKHSKSPPTQHKFEKSIKETIFESNQPSYSIQDPISEISVVRPPLYAIGWGWNANGRAGNQFFEQIHSPRQVQKSISMNYIGAASGQHHSLLVSDTGKIYSFGEGYQGELGYGNLFGVPSSYSHSSIQFFPHEVNPSGSFKFGKDLHITQVVCLENASIGREMSVDEGTEMIKGLKLAENSISKLNRIFPECEKLRRTWSLIRHERFKLNRVSEGQLISWGTGQEGQLGLGKYCLSSPSPQVIPSLKNISIRQISAGKNHVLAISMADELYSWGQGKSGKLGHGDFENRYEPTKVSFFFSFFVECVGAGDEHSAVITTDRKGQPRSEQQRRVICFGRGAHGRLGNGDNRTNPNPTLVSPFPASIYLRNKGGQGAGGGWGGGGKTKLQLIQVSCGGAHTLLLTHISLPPSLANPWRKESRLLAWGFGTNGQLGIGEQKDSFVPVRVRMPERCELVTEISTGKSWSLAKTIGGVLYSWGKGMRGELGHGDGIEHKFSFVPRVVSSPFSFLSLSSGHAHNICISTPRKYLNPEISIQASKQEDPLSPPLVPTSSIQREMKSAYDFDCCKVELGRSSRSSLRYNCITCSLPSVCFLCMRLCHRNHNVVERRPVMRTKLEMDYEVKKQQQVSRNQQIYLQELNKTWKGNCTKFLYQSSSRNKKQKDNLNVGDSSSLKFTQSNLKRFNTNTEIEDHSGYSSTTSSASSSSSSSSLTNFKTQKKKKEKSSSTPLQLKNKASKPATTLANKQLQEEKARQKFVEKKKRLTKLFDPFFRSLVTLQLKSLLTSPSQPNSSTANTLQKGFDSSIQPSNNFRTKEFLEPMIEKHTDSLPLILYPTSLSSTWPRTQVRWGNDKELQNDEITKSSPSQWGGKERDLERNERLSHYLLSSKNNNREKNKDSKSKSTSPLKTTNKTSTSTPTIYHPSQFLCSHPYYLLLQQLQIQHNLIKNSHAIIPSRFFSSLVPFLTSMSLPTDLQLLRSHFSALYQKIQEEISVKQQGLSSSIGLTYGANKEKLLEYFIIENILSLLPPPSIRSIASHSQTISPASLSPFKPISASQFSEICSAKPESLAFLTSPVRIKVPFCHCSVFHQHCRLLPTIPEAKQSGSSTGNDLEEDEEEREEFYVEEFEVSVDVPYSPETPNSKHKLAVDDTPVDPLRLYETYLQPGDIEKGFGPVQRKSTGYFRSLLITRKKQCSRRIIVKRPNDNFNSDFTSHSSALMQIRSHFVLESSAALKIQALGRGYLGRVKAKSFRRIHERIRYQTCETHYKTVILGSVFQKLIQEDERRMMEKENILMGIEDERKHKFDYYFNLQRALSGMNAIMFGIQRLVGMASPNVPRLLLDTNRYEEKNEQRRERIRQSSLSFLKKTKPFFPSNLSEKEQQLLAHEESRGFGQAARENAMKLYYQQFQVKGIHDLFSTSITRSYSLPSYCFSWASLRQQILMKPQMKRTSPPELALISRYYPREGGRSLIWREKLMNQMKLIMKEKERRRLGEIKKLIGEGPSAVYKFESEDGETSEEDPKDDDDEEESAIKSSKSLKSPTTSSKTSKRQENSIMNQEKIELELEIQKKEKEFRKRKILLRERQRQCQHIEGFISDEGCFFDQDVMLFTNRFVRDSTTLLLSEIQNYDLQQQIEQQQIKLQLAQERLLKARFATRDLLKQAEDILKPKPPSLPPPIEVIRSNLRERITQDRILREKQEKKEEKSEDSPFDSFTFQTHPHFFNKRRASIADPSRLYNRVIQFRPEIERKAFCQRRSSLPSRLSLYRPQEIPPLPYVYQIKRSLSHFSSRLSIVNSIPPPSHLLYIYHQEKKKIETLFQKKQQQSTFGFPSLKPSSLSPKVVTGDQTGLEIEHEDDLLSSILPVNDRNHIVRTVLTGSILSPSLPIEMKQLLLFPKRRRTISDCERLARTLHISFEIRNTLCTIRMREKEGNWGDPVESAKISVQNKGKFSKKFKNKDLLGGEFEKYFHNASHSGLLPNYRNETFPSTSKPTQNLTQPMVFRRRSFDYAEIREFESGITEKLGYVYEEPYQVPQMSDLRKDALKMDKSIILANLWVGGNEIDGEESLSVNDHPDIQLSRMREYWGQGSKENKIRRHRVDVESKPNPIPTPPSRDKITLWQEHTSQDGQVYFFCQATGESSWSLPQGKNVQILSPFQNDQGKWYWFNNSTQETSWANDLEK